MLVGLLIAVIAGGLSMVSELQYRAQTQVFVLPTATAGSDPFTLVKTAERIGDNLSHVVNTSSFFERVIERTNGTFSKSDFGKNDRVARKVWSRSISVTPVVGTGFVQVAAFDGNKRNAAILASAVAGVLAERGGEFVPGDVTIKEVDAVVLSRFPVRPNVPLNMIFGFLIGVLGVSLVELFRNPRHSHARELTAVDWVKHL